MCSKEEIAQLITTYQNRLIDMLIKKGSQLSNGHNTHELDIAMFFLIDRLETLYWVIDLEPENGNIFQVPGYYN